MRPRASAADGLALRPPREDALTPRSPELGLYVRELRLSLRNNAGAYGYSVMITSTMAMLTALHPPQPGDVVLFFVGAVASFALVEIIATDWFRRGLDDEETTRVVALGSSLHLVSIATAVGMVAVAAVVLPDWLGWLIGPFVASLGYLLMSAVEMTVARRVEEMRKLE